MSLFCHNHRGGNEPSKQQRPKLLSTFHFRDEEAHPTSCIPQVRCIHALETVTPPTQYQNHNPAFHGGMLLCRGLYSVWSATHKATHPVHQHLREIDQGALTWPAVAQSGLEILAQLVEGGRVTGDLQQHLRGTLQDGLAARVLAVSGGCPLEASHNGRDIQVPR